MNRCKNNLWLIYEFQKYNRPTSFCFIAGRRIEFDYEKFGHSPSCLGSNTNIVNGKEALVQGYGLSEDGKKSWVFDYIDMNERNTRSFNYNLDLLTSLSRRENIR